MKYVSGLHTKYIQCFHPKNKQLPCFLFWWLSSEETGKNHGQSQEVEQLQLTLTQLLKRMIIIWDLWHIVYSDYASMEVYYCTFNNHAIAFREFQTSEFTGRNIWVSKVATSIKLLDIPTKHLQVFLHVFFLSNRLPQVCLTGQVCRVGNLSLCDITEDAVKWGVSSHHKSNAFEK